MGRGSKLKSQSRIWVNSYSSRNWTNKVNLQLLFFIGQCSLIHLKVSHVHVFIYCLVFHHLLWMIGNWWVITHYFMMQDWNCEVQFSIAGYDTRNEWSGESEWILDWEWETLPFNSPPCTSIPNCNSRPAGMGIMIYYLSCPCLIPLSFPILSLFLPSKSWDSNEITQEEKSLMFHFVKQTLWHAKGH